MFTHAYTSVVEVSAASSGGSEQLLPHGVVYYGVLQAAFLLTGDGDRKHREFVQKVRRPVQGVDDPNRLVIPGRAAFLREKGVIRIVLADDADDLRLRLGIDLADESTPNMPRFFDGWGQRWARPVRGE